MEIALIAGRTSSEEGCNSQADKTSSAGLCQRPPRIRGAHPEQGPGPSSRSCWKLEPRKGQTSAHLTTPAPPPLEPSGFGSPNPRHELGPGPWVEILDACAGLSALLQRRPGSPLAMAEQLEGHLLICFALSCPLQIRIYSPVR